MTALGRGSARRILRSRRYVEDVVLVQQNAGTRNEFGEFVPGPGDTFPVQASIENVGLQTQSLLRNNTEAGERIVDYRYFFIFATMTDFARPVRVGINQTDSDTIQYAGLDWDIVQIEDYSNHGHLEIIAVRREGQNDGVGTSNT